jgi:hypothetical protein
MFEPTTPQLQPVVAYLQANQIEILHEDRSQSGAVVLSLKMQSGAIRTLTVNYEFLQTTPGDQIESYLKDHNFARRLEEQGNQHISKPSRT